MDTKTLYSRLATVPPQIRTHLGSEETIDTLEKIENQFHLPAGSLGASKLIQKLQIKDIGAEYFAGELAAEFKLEKNNALLISEEIKKSILTPLKKDFADYGIDINLLEKFQIPGPKILSEVKPPQASPKIPTPAPAPKPPAPQIISQSFTASPNVGATPLASNRNTPGVAPSPNKPNSDKGWSTRTPQNPVVTLGAISPAIPSPAAKTSPTIDLSQPSKPSASAAKGMSEFDRIDMMKKNNAPAAMPTTGTTTGQVQAIPKPPTPPTPPAPAPTPAASKDPAPIMLHEISAASAQSPQFRVNVGMQNQMGAGNASRSSMMPSKPAVLEFGGESNGSTAAPTAPKAVHYSEYKTTTPMPPPTNSGAPRQITEITKPAAMPTPSTPPKPPASPAPQSKVIVQDFLG